MSVTKADKELLLALNAVKNLVARQVLIKNLSSSAQDRVRLHLRHLLEGKKKQYRVSDKARAELQKALQRHKNGLNDFIENGNQKSGIEGLRLQRVVASLVPLLASLVAK